MGEAAPGASFLKGIQNRAKKAIQIACTRARYLSGRLRFIFHHGELFPGNAAWIGRPHTIPAFPAVLFHCFIIHPVGNLEKILNRLSGSFPKTEVLGKALSYYKKASPKHRFENAFTFIDISVCPYAIT
jgi:hypothetical protein